MGIRTLVDHSDPKDIEQAHALQNAINVSQNDPGKLELPNWDSASQKKVHDALLVLGTTIPDTKRMFGSRSDVDPVRHLIGSAILWGGLPEKDALYLNVTPDNTWGAAVYKLNVQHVPVDGFWSITVYDAKGYMEPNRYNAYSLNNITAEKNADGSVAVQFGGCDGKIPNCLPTMPGWNYMVRLYRPRAEILNGKWSFPRPQAAQCTLQEVPGPISASSRCVEVRPSVHELRPLSGVGWGESSMRTEDSNCARAVRARRLAVENLWIEGRAGGRIIGATHFASTGAT